MFAVCFFFRDLNDGVVVVFRKKKIQRAGLWPHWALMSRHSVGFRALAFIPPVVASCHVPMCNRCVCCRFGSRAEQAFDGENFPSSTPRSGWNLSQLGRIDLTHPSGTEPGESVECDEEALCKKIAWKIDWTKPPSFQADHSFSSSPTISALAWVVIFKWVVISDRSECLSALRLWSASQHRDSQSPLLWYLTAVIGSSFLACVLTEGNYVSERAQSKPKSWTDSVFQKAFQCAGSQTCTCSYWMIKQQH